jgi:hypothetical protein
VIFFFKKNIIRQKQSYNPHPNSIPFNFYIDCNIDYKYFWEYFHIAECKESKELFNKLNTDYIFVHNISSTGEVFSVNYIEKSLT